MLSISAPPPPLPLPAPLTDRHQSLVDYSSARVHGKMHISPSVSQFLSFLRDACIINHRTKKYFIYLRRGEGSKHIRLYATIGKNTTIFSLIILWPAWQIFIAAQSNYESPRGGSDREMSVYFGCLPLGGGDELPSRAEKRNKTNQKRKENWVSAQVTQFAAGEKRFTTEENENWKIIDLQQSETHVRLEHS